MNLAGDDPQAAIDPAVWEGPSMRAALRIRDVGEIYRLLKRHGVSQRRIGALTGQSQPEVSEISKSLQVMAYDVLARIADGLGIPRGHMGLAYDNSIVATSTTRHKEGDDPVERRGFIGLVAKAAMIGLSAAELQSIAIPSSASATPAPTRVGNADLDHLDATLAFFRTQEYQVGGGAIASAISGHLDYATGLLRASATDEVRQRAQLTVADLYSQAGWAWFDIGQYATAKRHLANALVLANDGNHPMLAAKVLSDLGEVYLDQGDAQGPLKMFQLGQVSAQEANSGKVVALLYGNITKAYSAFGKADHASAMLARAYDELARDTGRDTPVWLSFMNAQEIEGSAGKVYSTLAAHNRVYAEKAIEHSTRSYEMRPGNDLRYSTSDLIKISANNLRAGNVNEGIRTANTALANLETVRSTRLMSQLALIQQGAALYPRQTRDLAEHLTAARAR